MVNKLWLINVNKLWFLVPFPRPRLHLDAFRRLCRGPPGWLLSHALGEPPSKLGRRDSARINQPVLDGALKIPIGSMVLEYLPTFTPKMAQM